jgi:hypothetical protein
MLKISELPALKSVDVQHAPMRLKLPQWQTSFLYIVRHE